MENFIMFIALVINSIVWYKLGKSYERKKYKHELRIGSNDYEKFKELISEYFSDNNNTEL